MKKILHLCLGCFYIDGFSYQENLITKHHKLMGYDVEIIASQQTFDEDGHVSFFETGPRTYVNEYGIKTTRIDYKYKNANLRRLKHYVGLAAELEKSDPDIIFIHGSQFSDAKIVAAYLRNHPDKKAFVDCHAQTHYCATNWFSMNVLHKFLWRRAAQSLEPYVDVFWGITDNSCKFMEELYRLPKEKIGLLPLGIDDEIIDFDHQAEIRSNIRAQFDIADDDLLLVTGGKIGMKKAVHTLAKALESSRLNAKLLVFGPIDDEVQKHLDEIDQSIIRYAGWCDAKKTYDIYLSSDLAVFPGTQSSLWAQAVACGLPAIFRYWEGGNPVDLEGNCIILKDGTCEEIVGVLNRLADNVSLIDDMRSVAMEKGIESFAYSRLAKKAICE